MTTQHTPEPLDYREADEEEQYMRGCDFVIEQRDFTDNCKQIVAYCDDEHDASRIVACVNACAGVDTETLVAMANGEMTGSEIWELAKVKQQRDELLAALKEIAEYPRTQGHEFSAAGLRFVAREAIAKARGKI